MSETETPVEQLSDREMEVLEKIATGATNKEIAEQLIISVHTVKVHVRNIRNKLGVSSKMEAAMWAIQEGVVILPGMEETAPAPNETPETAEAAPPPPPPTPAETPLSWGQQIYLAVALFLAALVAFVPLGSTQANQTTVEIPIIAKTLPTPAPPAPDNWRFHDPLRSQRAGLGVVAYENKIYAIAGMGEGNQTTRLMERYDPETNRWEVWTRKPTAVANISVVLIDETIYVPGGCDEEGNAMPIMEQYSPQTDSWADGPPMPAARCAYGLAMVNEQLYLFGGWDGGQFTDTVFEYSPQTEQWRELETSLPQPLGYFGVSVLNEQIYIVGGYDGTTEFADTYRFSPQTESWESLAPMLYPRGGLGVVTFADRIFAIGGGWETPVTVSEQYNPETDSWSAFETPFADAWRNMGLVAIDTQFYAVGGWNMTSQEYMEAVTSYQSLYQLFLPLSPINPN